MPPMTYPEGAEKYQAFRESVLSAAPVVREPDLPEIPELELQAMWFGGEFGRSFIGTGGEEIEIIQFGHWNRSAGPDFTEAAVRVNGETRSGAVEIDLEAASWEEHGHGANPAFDDVALHVFLHPPFRGNFFTRNSQHQSIPQLRLDVSLLSIARARDLPEAYPGRCLAPLQGMSDESVESLLQSAAQFRVRKKWERLAAMSAATSSRQTMFQAIAEALGFRRNKIAMAILAQRNPLAELLDLEPASREARLFGSAGFMTSEIYDPALSPDASDYLKKLWDHWWKIRPAEESDETRAIPWDLAATRPMNHPQRRIGAIAAILQTWNRLAAVWERLSSNVAKTWSDRCVELHHPYWERHYTLASAPAKSSMKLVGPDRQRDLLGNVIFPWLLGKDAALWEEYAALPKVDSNEKLRRALLRLFGSGETSAKKFSRKYFQQQALLQIYQDFCLADSSECRDCPFPEQLEQWK